jgi:hypothetical protein
LVVSVAKNFVKILHIFSHLAAAAAARAGGQAGGRYSVQNPISLRKNNCSAVPGEPGRKIEAAAAVAEWRRKKRA